MRKFLIILLALVMLTGCKTTYYMYYEVESPDNATSVSRIDGYLARNRKSPTRCMQSYVDSTGVRVYLMETRIREKYIQE